MSWGILCVCFGAVTSFRRRFGHDGSVLDSGFARLGELPLEPVPLALDGDDDTVVQEPIEQGGDQNGVLEQLCPLGEALVAGDHQGGVFVAPRDEPEEKETRAICNFV